VEDLSLGIGSIFQVGWELEVSILVGPAREDRVECVVPEVNEREYSSCLEKRYDDREGRQSAKRHDVRIPVVGIRPGDLAQCAGSGQ